MNRLANATSPYLLQHAHNPVHWQPWGAEAFAQARREQKLVLVSIGYSACHWCHVMERESFEDAAVAAVMNEHYICIKVDREERPDVDHTYMDAVQLMRGQGGWPLNCFTLPDGRPIFGGTYFPKGQWLQVLKDLTAFWQREPERAMAYATDLTEAVRQLEVAGAVPAEAQPQATLEEGTRAWITYQQRYDSTNGGLGTAPKFPVPSNWRFLLHYATLARDGNALEAVLHTLDQMAAGGIYDQIGGGFARYSVDEAWRVPHFEKMLYDNAQLVHLYSEALRALKSATDERNQARAKRYQGVIHQTLTWLQDEMLHRDGGFYSALDADSEGVEGKFYVWDAKDFDAVVGPEVAPLLAAKWNVDEAGNWEHGQNILFQTVPDAELAQRFGINSEQLDKATATAQAALLKARNTRVRPGLDDKVLTGWNGMMVRGLVEAFRATGLATYLELAQQNDAFIERTMADGPALRRVWSPRNGKAGGAANLEDYAHNLDALLALYQATFDEQYLLRARDRYQYIHELFYDEGTGLYWFTAEDHEGDGAPQIARKQEVHDSVVASSNSVLAHVILSLGALLDNQYYRDRAVRMLAAVHPHFEKYPTSFSNWQRLLLRQAVPDKEVAICGPQAPSYRAALDQHYLPDALLCGTLRDVEGHTDVPLLGGKCNPGKTMIYVCQNRACQLPTAKPDEALAQLRA